VLMCEHLHVQYITREVSIPHRPLNGLDTIESECGRCYQDLELSSMS